jgi:hypothetical protein
MKQISYRRHRFPGSIIQHAVWLYFRFSLSYRDIEDLLSERGIDVTCETIRRWALKFGSAYAHRLRRLRPRRDCRWHLDKVFVSPRPTSKAVQTPPYGFRVSQQNASVHADPWSSGECRVELAKLNNVDSVITISNQFTAFPEQHPIGENY